MTVAWASLIIRPVVGLTLAVHGAQSSSAGSADGYNGAGFRGGGTGRQLLTALVILAKWVAASRSPFAADRWAPPVRSAPW